MRRRIVALAVLGAALALVGVAGARTGAIHTHYAFSFSVASKPDDTGGGTGPKITGERQGHVLDRAPPDRP